MCIREWQCIGPCENSVFGDLLEFNEMTRQKFKAFIQIWLGFWPILLPIVCVVVTCCLCSCRSRMAKIYELETAVKHLYQNLKTLQESLLSGRARDGGRHQ